MTWLERNADIAAVVIPFLGVIGAGRLLWNRFLDARDLAIFAVLYVLTAGGGWDVVRVTPERARERLAGNVTKPRLAGNGAGLACRVTAPAEGATLPT